MRDLEGRSLWMSQLRSASSRRHCGQNGVQGGEHIPQAMHQNHLSVVVAPGVGRFGCDIRSVLRLLPEAGQPIEGSLFSIGFGDSGHGSLSWLSKVTSDCSLCRRKFRIRTFEGHNKAVMET